jgi:hypothetical protein
LRRQAEQAQDEVEAKYRWAEGSLSAVREECDAVHEELAFKESELEETRLELEIERERHRVELEESRSHAGDGRAPIKEEDTVNTDEAAASGEGGGSFPTVDDAYVKKLEDELELVTEQLIETEARLSHSEDRLSNLESKTTESDMDRLLSDVDAVDVEKDKELIRSS